MKRILLLLGILFCSFNMTGTEKITSGYCEGRKKILKKAYDPYFLTVLTTYKSCLINDTKYNNIKVHRTYSKYKKNAVIPEKEVFSKNSNYCADVDHNTGNLLIYPTNIEGECEMLHQFYIKIALYVQRAKNKIKKYLTK